MVGVKFTRLLSILGSFYNHSCPYRVGAALAVAHGPLTAAASPAAEHGL